MRAARVLLNRQAYIRLFMGMVPFLVCAIHMNFPLSPTAGMVSNWATPTVNLSAASAIFHCKYYLRVDAKFSFTVHVSSLSDFRRTCHQKEPKSLGLTKQSTFLLRSHSDPVSPKFYSFGVTLAD